MSYVNTVTAPEAAAPLQRRGSSFFLPMLLLSAPKRKAMQALYYFCRAADDAVDEASSAKEAEQQLAFWEAEIEQLYGEKHPQHPVSKQLMDAIERYDMPRRYFDDLLQALKHDCADSVTLPDWEALQHYCYGVAGCVGLQAVRIFGCADEKGEAFAKALGQALQLTNILRDIEEDAEEGRCYIPQSWLAEAGITAKTPQAIAQEREALQPIRTKMAEKAEAFFAEAANYAQQIPTQKILPALLMRDVYYRYLQQLKAGQRPKKPGVFGFVLLMSRAFSYRFL